MTIEGKLMTGLIICGFLLASPAYCIKISVSSNAGGFTEVIDAGFADRVSGSTVIGSDRLSNSIQGEGRFKESHSVSNKAGATAEVGVDIRDAEWYSYSYDLWPGSGTSWKAAKSPQVAASEELDVLNASYIEAYADAFNSKGYTAGVSTVISDPGNEATLTGYSNLAMASKNEAFATQTTENALAPDGYIQSEASADFTQLKSRPLRLREDKAEASIRVDSGSIEGYSDLASASALGVTASQQVDAMAGESIQTRSEASLRTASLFQGLKAERAKVSTQAEGSLTGYNASARSYDGTVFADQTSHIIGSFTSTALADEASKTRSSNYGDKYDFSMQARKDASGSYATGNLGYYIDNVSPTANRIQGAVDASESGDAINVALGIYFENVRIDKSLDIRGAGAGETIVDGQQSESVFVIGKDNPDVDVAISDMTIQGGNGSPMELYPGNTVNSGGGILNYGTLNLTDIIISGNTAGYGGGIANIGGALNLNGDSGISSNIAFDNGGGIFDWYGTVDLTGVNIDGNYALNGGGIFNSYGTVNLTEGNITENNVEYSGAGIYSDHGKVNLTGSNITGNNAMWSGGGIFNFAGIVNLTGSNINRNYALDGGGIFNSYGTVNLAGGDSRISGNTAGYTGGAIYSTGRVTIANVSPSIGSLISDNSAQYGGAIYNKGTLTIDTISPSIGSLISNNSAEYGGAIYNAGTLTIANVSPTVGSTISHNSAQLGGGIYNDYSGIVNLFNGSIDHNNAAKGGGIFNMGTMELNGTLVDNNTATEKGGGVYNDGTAMVMDSTISGNTAYEGSGIFNGAAATLNIDGSTISGNSAYWAGGGVHNSGTTRISDSIISGNSASYGGGVVNSGTATIKESAISLNNAEYSGGGIYSSGTATITGNNIFGNSAYWGGGVFNYWGTAAITDSTISGNSAGVGGGVLNYYIGTATIADSTISGNSADVGGGVVNEDKATISGSTISGNSAQYGGGVYNSNFALAIISGSTISTNNADRGGGIYNEGYGTVNLDDNSYISNNTATSGGGIYNKGYSTVNLNNNSYISGNTAAKGGGIFNDYYGIVNLNRGSIDHNNATSPAPSGGGIYNLGTITGNTSIVHDNTPDQIVDGVDWLPTT